MNHYPPNYYPQAVPQTASSSGLKIIFIIIVPMLWLGALWLPAYTNDTRGFVCLIFGWSMVLTGNFLAFLAWMGNFLFWTSFFMLAIGKRKKVLRASSILAGIAFVFSFGALTVSEVSRDYSLQTEEVGIDIGAWVWIFSNALLVTGAILAAQQAPEIIPVPLAQQPYYPPQNYYGNYPPPFSQTSVPPVYTPPQTIPPINTDPFPSQIPQTYIPPSEDPFSNTDNSGK
jgi:hypothetical protein